MSIYVKQVDEEAQYITMIKEILEILVDPNDQGELISKYSIDGSLISLVNKEGKEIFLKHGVLDFTDKNNNYTDNFGDQWMRYPRLQLDSFNGTTISQDRFFRALGLRKDELRGKLILDAGCGTGRFAEIALQAGAIVIGLDYSYAAYVAAENLKKYTNFQAIRGDIYKLPFKKNSFDLVYCLGVLQHTPNVERAFKSLPPILKKQGYLVVDYYWKRLRSLLSWRYLIRKVTSKLQSATVLRILSVVHPILYPFVNFLSKIPVIGRNLSRFFPIVNYTNDYPELGQEMLRAWSFLDTYDNWAPKFDKPQSVITVTKWANDVGLYNVVVKHAGHMVVRGYVR